MFLARISLLSVIVIAAGCGDTNNGTPRRGAVSRQVEELRGQKAELERRLEQADKENEGLKKQMEALAGLPGDKKAESIYRLKALKIGRYTNLYDEDKNGTKETLIVYVQPIDETGDVIKAAGAVDVQLWDLNKPSTEALVSQWSVAPNELRKLWVDSIALTGYRLTYGAGGKVEKFDSPLTVKVTFTDYLSGRTFSEQKAIKP